MIVCKAGEYAVRLRRISNGMALPLKSSTMNDNHVFLPPANADTSTLVVGDIHGCFQELIDLCTASGIRPGRDRIISVGDMIDRGPDSVEVIRFFRDTENAYAVMGNHEYKFLKGFDPDDRDPSGLITSYQLSSGESEEVTRYCQELPYSIETDEVLIVHAGLEPGTPLTEQKPKVMLGVGSMGRPFFGAKPPYWWDLVEYAKPIIFGHRISKESVIRGDRKNVWGIDAGCVHGGYLRGVMVPELRVVAVKAHEDHCRNIKKEWLPVVWSDCLPARRWGLLPDPETQFVPSETVTMLDKMWRERAELISWFVRIVASARERSDFVNKDPARKQAISTAVRDAAAKTRFPALSRCFFHPESIESIVTSIAPSYLALHEANAEIRSALLELERAMIVESA
jgi:serine/threonine protein phosphatase 1